MSRVPFLLLGLVVGCTSRTVLEIELPEPAGMQTMLLGLEYQEDLRVYAVGLDDTFDPDVLPHVDDFEGSARAYALFYRATLEEVGLAPGEIQPESDPSRAAPFMDFDAAFERRLREGEADSAWTNTSTDGDVIDFRITAPPPDLSHCPEFTITAFDIPSQQRFFATVAMGDNEVLAFGYRGDVFRVTSDGATAIAPTRRLDDVRAATRAPNGEVWVSTSTTVLRGHPERGYEAVMQDPLDTPVHWMVSPPDGDRDELFILTRGGAFRRILDGDVTDLIDLDTMPTNSDHLGGLAWLGPDDVVGVPPETLAVVTIPEGRPDVTFTSATILTTLQTVTRAGSSGFAALLGNGLILTTDVQRSGLVEAGMHIAHNAYAAAPHLDGFVYADRGLRLVYGELNRLPCAGPAESFDDRFYEVFSIVPMTRNRLAMFAGIDVKRDNAGADARVFIVESER